MRSRNARNMSGSALMGLAVGAAAGIATGLLAAPMRGGDMRATIRRRAADGRARVQSLTSSTRSWAQHAIDRGWQAVEDGRRAYHAARNAAPPRPLTTPLSEVASLHRGGQSSNWEARS
jgi:gas vesicle protein